MSAELAARRTAAAAVLADFRREVLDALNRCGPQPDWASWAHRLSAMLGTVLMEDSEPAVMLAGDQAATVASALADAEWFLRERAGAWCENCKTHPAGACEQHIDDLDQADEYRQVAAELAKEAGR